MDLSSVYSVVNILNEGVVKGNIDRKILREITISVNVSRSILFGIDKEFYKISHENSLDGFVHTDKVYATIDNVRIEFIKDKNIKE